MKKLLIIGAGNVGGYISFNINEFPGFELIGFLDDNPDKHGKEYYGLKVLGPVLDIDKFLSVDEPLHVAIGIANPAVKKKIAKLLEGKNIIFPSLIPAHTWLSKKVIVGKGVILYPGVSVNYETVLEDFVIMNMNCAIGHNCHISAYSTLAPGVNLGGFTYIGTATDIGIGTSTRQGIKIGSSVVVGGQTMIARDIPDNVKVKGVPAREY